MTGGIDRRLNDGASEDFWRSTLSVDAPSPVVSLATPTTAIFQFQPPFYH
jgi:hypothetical protein